MKKIILGILLVATTLAALPASSAIIRVTNKGWYAADITIKTNHLDYYLNDLLLGQHIDVVVGDNDSWNIWMNVNGSVEDLWKYDNVTDLGDSDPIVKFDHGVGSVDIELHGTVLGPSMRRV